MEFIEAPAGAPIGERIGLEGLDMVDPITPAQIKKQKVWEEMVTKVRVPCPHPACCPRLHFPRVGALIVSASLGRSSQCRQRKSLSTTASL